jgi:hypothetical protein
VLLDSIDFNDWGAEIEDIVLIDEIETHLYNSCKKAFSFFDKNVSQRTVYCDYAFSVCHYDD